MPSKCSSNGCRSLPNWKTQGEDKDKPMRFARIVLIAILATIGGATGWEDIEVYASSHQPWLETFLDLSHGVPHADTYRRAFERVNPESQEQ